MSWSLNEVEGLTRKAVRGSGASWGVAEEAGKSLRWLTAVGLPGADHLSRLLTLNDGVAYDMLRPRVTEGAWSAEGGRLCPLVSGAVICDYAAEIAAGREIQLLVTSHPMLLLPYTAGVADLTRSKIAITWQGTAATLAPGGLIGFSEKESIDVEVTDSVGIHATTTDVADPLSSVSRAKIAGATARVLGDFAHRTYAPDTPESRLSGAGAGLTDND